MTADESEAANEDLWLTYQNYDPAVKQAVRRLGALPGNNVEEFRTLLLASRERSRVKEFEADVVRRLQGEAFVGDEVLQQTLIVLHAENPHLAEQFKKLVAAHGKPDDIDLAVARLKSGTDDPVMPERMPRKPRETPVMPQLIDSELPADPAPVMLEPAPEVIQAAPVKPAPPASPVAPRARPVAQRAPRVAPTPIAANQSEPDQRHSWTRRVAALAAVLLVGAVGFFLLAPKSGNKPAIFEATNVPLRQAAVEDKQPAPATVPGPVAEPAQVAQPAPAQPAAPAMEARDQVNIPAPEPPASEAAAAPASSNGPVPGTHYKVLKGDMLSVIAQQAYGDASLYPLIQRANPGLRNADRIYYDQVITLPPQP